VLTTGVPQAIASSGGNPKPSARDGNANTRAAGEQARQMLVRDRADQAQRASEPMLLRAREDRLPHRGVRRDPRRARQHGLLATATQTRERVDQQQDIGTRVVAAAVQDERRVELVMLAHARDLGGRDRREARGDTRRRHLHAIGLDLMQPLQVVRDRPRHGDQHPGAADGHALESPCRAEARAAMAGIELGVLLVDQVVHRDDAARRRECRGMRVRQPVEHVVTLAARESTAGSRSTRADRPSG
jgi:hypothetical protein